MPTPQSGIFALGTVAQCFLELDRRPGVDARAAVAALAALDEPRSTVGGVNLVVGVRPGLWAEAVDAEQVPSDAADFAEPVGGPDNLGGFTMPATQRDLWLWIAGAAHDVVFDTARSAIAALAAVAYPALEVSGWSYHHSRDLTGFIDGTANPSLTEAPSVVAVPEDEPGAGCSVVLVQQWLHDFEAWTRLPVERQEEIFGRTKADSVELGDIAGRELPDDSHVARTTVEVDGVEHDIFRRNLPWGTVSRQGTMFVGFSNSGRLLHRMLARMTGAEGGVRDALTRYSTPLTGAYYVVPPVESLAALAADGASAGPGEGAVNGEPG